MGEAGVGVLLIPLLMFLVMGAIWLLPIVLIAKSQRTQGNEKLIWILACIFVSWFAWVLYLLIAPVNNNTGGR